jgi:membrane protein
VTSAVEPGVFVASTVTALSGFFVSWLLILLLYRLVPDSKVKWRPLLVGSFLAAVSWELGKWAFGLYVQHAAKNSWYGSLALLPLFMFWIYITWSVVLLGLELTFVQQYWPSLKRQFFFSRCAGGAGHLSDLRWVLSLGVLVYRQFKQGKVTEVSEAAELLMLPNDVTARLLDGLENAGLMHEVRDGAYALARPPDSITAQDLLTAARALCQVPPELAREVAHVQAYPTSPAVQELERLEDTWAKNHALPALAGDELATS